jgi:hypothetical protein
MQRVPVPELCLKSIYNRDKIAHRCISLPGFGMSSPVLFIRIRKDPIFFKDKELEFLTLNKNHHKNNTGTVWYYGNFLQLPVPVPYMITVVKASSI